MTAVLLVEDNDDNARALQRLLGRRGFTVTIVGTGEGVMPAVLDSPPALVLMDIGLPDTDGLTITRRLKADPATAAIPVIALTAHAMSEDKAEATAAGCDDFCAKPINLPDLLARMRGVLTAAEGPAAPDGG
jgi:CheY-like chemotaxis protein